MTAATLSPALADTVLARFARRRLAAFAVPLAILAYLAYAAMAFDLAGLAGRARMDNAAVLLSDFWQHKTHVTRDNRSGALRVAIDGEAKGTYPPDRLPGWIAHYREQLATTTKINRPRQIYTGQTLRTVTPREDR